MTAFTQVSILPAAQVRDDIPFGLSILWYIIRAIEGAIGGAIPFDIYHLLDEHPYHVFKFGPYTFRCFVPCDSNKTVAMVAFAIVVEFLTLVMDHYEFNVTYCTCPFRFTIMICKVGVFAPPYMLSLEECQVEECHYQMLRLVHARRYTDATPQGGYYEFNTQAEADQHMNETIFNSLKFMWQAYMHPEVSRHNAFNSYGDHPPSETWFPDLRGATSQRSMFDQFKYYLNQSVGLNEDRSLLSEYVNVDRSVDPVLKLAEDVAILMYNLAYSTDNMSRYVALVNYAKLRRSKVNLVAVLGVAIYNHFGLKSKPEEPELQSAEEVVYNLRSALDSVEEAKSNPLVKKLKKFGLYVLSLELFPMLGLTLDKCGYEEMEIAYFKQKYKADASFLYLTLDLAVFIAEKGIQCVKLGRLDPLIHDTRSYQEWYDMAITLRRNSAYTSNPEVIPGFNIQRYLADLDDTLAKSVVVKKMVKPNTYESRMINTLIADLELCKINELSRRMAQKERKSPFAVLLAGGSSIGKSSLTQILFHQYGKLFDLPCEPEFKYTRLATEKHWTNFASYAWCIQCDDIAFMKPGNEPDPSLMEMLLLNNNVPYTPEQAALGDKGRTPVRAEFIIATSNTEHLNLHAYFSCPFAVARRFPYIIVPEVKREYAHDDKTLDSSKVPPTPEGGFDDLWTFTIKKPIKKVEATNAPHALEIVCVFDGIKPFLKWFSKEARKHQDIQRRVVNTNSSMLDIKLCERCDLPTNLCDCVAEELQSAHYVNMTEIRRHLKDTVKSFNDTATLAGYYFCEQTRKWMCPLCEKNESHYCALRGDFEFKLDDDGYKPIVYDPSERDRLILANLNYIDRMRMFWLIIWFKLASFTLLDSWFQSIWGQQYRYKWYYSIVKDHSVARRFFVNALAHRVENYVNVPKCCKVLVAMSGTLFACVALYKFFTPAKSKSDPQGGVQSTGMKPEADAVQIEKPYYFHDPYVINDIDVQKTVKACPREAFIKRVEYNTARFRMTVDPPSQSCARHYSVNNALCVGGCVWMVSKHAIPPESQNGQHFYLDVIFDDVLVNVSRNMKDLLICYSQIWQCSNDIVFIEIKNLPPMKSLKDFFVTPAFKFYGDGILKGVSQTGSRFQHHQKNLKKMTIYSTVLGQDIEVYDGIMTEGETVKGDCGSPLVHSTMNIILGVHLLLEPQKGVLHPASTCVYADQVNEALTKFSSGKIQSGEIRVNAPSSIQRNIVPHHFKSAIRFIEHGSLVSVGSLDGFRASNSSKVTATHIKEAVLKRGYKDMFGKPAMNWEPWHVALKDLSRPVTLLDQGSVDLCKRAFIKEIFDRLTDADFKTVMIYDLDTVINGADGVRFVDKMNRSTSAGFPYKKSKKHFISEHPEEKDKVLVCQEILDEADYIVENYKQGILCHPIFNGNLKDEAKKIIDKIKKKCKMTRMFCGSTFASSIVTRQYLLSVIKLMQENTYVFEAAVGIIAQSLEWEHMREHLATFSLERVVAGDYAAFDKRMSSTMILAAFDIIIAICERAGYDEEAINIVRCIAYDTAFPVVDYNGDLIQFYGSNPSGHSLTVIINSLVNSLYMRYCFDQLGGNVFEFKKNVCLMTYGDDNIMTVSDKCDFFNHTAIQKVLADCDIKYTMADKDAESVPFISINDATFLKRQWRWDDACGAYLAPLDSTSFDKMLTTRVRSDNISSETHSIFVISSAIRDYFFYGKEVYEEKLKMFKEIIVECELEPYVNESTLPSWEHLNERFWLNSQHVKLKRPLARPYGKYNTACDVKRPIIGDEQEITDC